MNSQEPSDLLNFLEDVAWLFAHDNQPPPPGFRRFMDGVAEVIPDPPLPVFDANEETTTHGGGHGNSPPAAPVQNVPRPAINRLGDEFPAPPEDPQPVENDLLRFFHFSPERGQAPKSETQPIATNVFFFDTTYYSIKS
jgi:hypothetical protein